MRYQQLSADFYIGARKRFASHMQKGGVAVFCSNDTYPTSADGHFAFKQATDIFYLSGVDQEESILLLFPDSFHAHHREVLFLKETSETIAIWEGAKLTKEQARTQTGIKTVYWLGEFERVFKAILAEASCIYLNNNEHTRAVVEVETREARFSKWVREHYPHYRIERSAPIMHRLRAVKEKEEVNQLQHAIDITRGGFERVMKMVKPGVMEYELEAEYMHEFLSKGSRGFAYTPIIASGFSACVLHYIDNDKPCKDGDLLLMDVGAEYGNYNADMTRTIPVNGRYTKRQRQVYDADLRVEREAASMLRPGVTIQDYHREVGLVMQGELLGLGLLDQTDIKNQDPKWPAYKKYFMHGTSHHLGLDVHDVGTMHYPISAGMVFTVEPGIYIPEEGFAVRIENDIVVQANGYLDLMRNIPIEAEEIESLMNR